eukprot:1304860-Ditylum_brightwellii.AAC.1
MDKNATWRTSLEDFKADIGFGLHTGCAIEGTSISIQNGFGYAISEIIAKSLSDSGELNPMVPGVKVNAIFDFVISVTSLLQQRDCNRILEISNIKNGGRSNLQKDLFDASLTSMHKIIADIRGMGTLAAFLQAAKVTTFKKPSTHHFNLKLKAQQCKVNNGHLIITGQEAGSIIIKSSPTMFVYAV